MAPAAANGTSSSPSATTIVAATAAAVAVGAAAATLAARRRAALAERAAEPSPATPASSAAAARRWNAQNPAAVFQVAVFFVEDRETALPQGPAALIMHPRRGAVFDLLSAVDSSAAAAAAPANPATATTTAKKTYRLFLSLSGTGAGPFVELAPASPGAGGAPAFADPDARALGALEEATRSAKCVAVAYACAFLPGTAGGGGAAAGDSPGLFPAVARKLAPHPGLVPVPWAPGGLPSPIGHALLAARGPYMHPQYNLAHHLFFAPAGAGASSSSAGGGGGAKKGRGGSGAKTEREVLRVRLPAMAAPRGVVLVPSSSPDGAGDDPEAWRTVLMTRDPRVVAEMLVREDVWPKKFDRPPQERLRDFAGPGLFTSSSDEPDWVTAHGVLPKLFNALRVTAMFPAVMTKTRAFVARWAALAPAAAAGAGGAGTSGSGANNAAAPTYAVVDHASDWLTSMTIDAVVLAAVGADLKNVERLAEGRPLHPFITAFRYGLGYAVGNMSVAREFGTLAALNPLFDGQGALRRKYLEAKGQCGEIVAALVEQTRRGELRGCGGQPNVIAAMMADRSTADGSLVPVTSFYGHMINIMIAGHETTAATLGFTLTYLSAHPDCEQKVLDELYRVLGVDEEGDGGQGGSGSGGNKTPVRAIREPTAADIGKLPYLEACFREALRLHPAVVAVTRDAARDTALLGKYKVSRGQRAVVNIVALHRHEDHWSGPGLKPVDQYDPERFMPPHVNRRHPSAWAGFGFGSRACIGSAFALLEAKTFLAVLLPRFSIRAVGKATASDPAPAYPYPPPASLADGGAAPTPHGLRLRVQPRAGFVAAQQQSAGASEAGAAAAVPGAAAAAAAAGSASSSFSVAAAGGDNLRASGTPIPSPQPSTGGAGAGGAAAAAAAAGGGATGSNNSDPVPFHVLFGSNSGTCEALASRVAEVAAASGFSPVRLTSLDAAHAAIKADGGAALSLPRRAAVAVVCSTYNGTPPDNARAFLQWAQKGAAAEGGGGAGAGGRIPPGVGYCVLGLGNSQWAATYQKVPRQLDEALAAYGATRVRALRAVDVNEPDFEDAFEAWLGTLGAEMRVHFGLEEAAGKAAGRGQQGTDGAAQQQQQQQQAGADSGTGASAAAAAAPPPPTLASLAPAPRFKLEIVEGVLASSPDANALLASKATKAPAALPLPLCRDIADVSRAIVAFRRALAAAGAPSGPVGGNSEPYNLLRVLKNEELQQPGSDRSTRHVELELPALSDLDRCGIVASGDGSPPAGAQAPLAYEAGDHLEVLGCNAPALVDAALRALRLTGDEVVVWTPAAGRSARGVGAGWGSDAGGSGNGASSSPSPAAAAPAGPLAVTTTSRIALSWVADLGAPPSRRLVEALVGACACPPERRAAHDKYASDTGYKQNVLLARLTVPELLSAPELRSAPPPALDALLLALPRVAPRYYSISSSPLASEGRARRTCSITVGLVRFNTGSGRVHEGAASSLVHRVKAVQQGGGEGAAPAAPSPSSLDDGDHVLLGTVRRLQSTFRLPSDPSAPIIMIGPGTGVAPMMGFLQEREVLLARAGGGKKGGNGAGQSKLGAAHLFFGCRSDTDFIYRERLEGYAKTGVLTGLHVAYSRKEGVPKTYVQDLIEQHGAELWRLLSAAPSGEGGAAAAGRVYVCGDARRMAPDVRAAFRDLAVRHGGRSEAAADAWMGSMIEGARYLEDVWAGNN